MSFELVIFDLDGTLIDTKQDVFTSFNKALVQCGHAPVEIGLLLSLLGKPLDDIVRGLLGGTPPDEDIKEVGRVYKSIHASSEKPNTRPFPGIPQLCKTLQDDGILLAVNTNKPQESAISTLKQLLPEIDFLVVGLGTVSTVKPDPQGVFDILTQLNVQVENALYIGDTGVDRDTALNAGVEYLIVDWGQGSSELFSQIDPARIVSNTDHILAFMR